MDHAPEVDADHPLPRRERHLPRQPAAADAGVVAEHVHAAEARDGGVGERLHLRGVGHVGDDAFDLGARLAQLGDRVVERGRFDVTDDDPGAFGREPTGQREPDPARAARDDRDFSVEILHGRMLTRPGRAGSSRAIVAPISSGSGRA